MIFIYILLVVLAFLLGTLCLYIASSRQDIRSVDGTPNDYPKVTDRNGIKVRSTNEIEQPVFNEWANYINQLN